MIHTCSMKFSSIEKEIILRLHCFIVPNETKQKTSTFYIVIDGQSDNDININNTCLFTLYTYTINQSESITNQMLLMMATKCQ